jgi:hypothetical protein
MATPVFMKFRGRGGHSRDWTRLTHLHPKKKKKTHTLSLVSCARTSDFVFWDNFFNFFNQKNFGKILEFGNFFLAKIDKKKFQNSKIFPNFAKI